MKKSILAITTSLFLALFYWANYSPNISTTNIEQSVNDTTKPVTIIETNPINSSSPRTNKKCCVGNENSTIFKQLEREKAKRKAAREKYQKQKAAKTKKTASTKMPKA